MGNISLKCPIGQALETLGPPFYGGLEPYKNTLGAPWIKGRPKNQALQTLKLLAGRPKAPR